MNDYRQQLADMGQDPEGWEQHYRQAESRGEASAFASAVAVFYEQAPDDLFFAAWYYRLRDVAQATAERVIAWGWALPLAFLNGLLYWWLSDMERYKITVAESWTIPLLVLLVTPIAAVAVLAFLSGAGKRSWSRAAIISLLLAVVTGYTLWAYRYTGGRSYLTLMAFHLPLVAWAAVAAYLLHGHHDPANRFAFLQKSLEVGIMAGLFAIAGGIFSGISLSMFDTLGITISERVFRLFFAGGGGLIPVLAVAIIYDPAQPPAAQSFTAGLNKLIALLLRLLLPLSILVLLIFLALVPTHFDEPFRNRDVLIIYNIMMFAVVALLMAVSPLQEGDLSPDLQRWLRRGIVVLAVLAWLVGLYALAAISWRTWHDHLTPNRLVFIGWNVINLFLLGALLWRQWRSPASRWLPALHSVFSRFATVYLIWALLMLIILPWLFGSGLIGGRVVNMPPALAPYVQDDVAPVILKCTASPHIYVIQKDGNKHWVKDIPTFEAQGYEWSDIQFVPCDVLRAIPDGQPIPPDAGPPPQP